MKSRHYLCVHGHFYQPPRENPWLEAIDYQESAGPFHDWNERINYECYRPNGQSRILDSQGRVDHLTNNYARISFNFGPTLLSWLAGHDADAYQALQEADRLSAARFGGHGSAIAQAYNHAILPLATRRDKETQIKWGLADFVKRFGRPAEAMWLPETAVDSETLEILADHGMKYVILAPRQAQAVRPIGQEDWHDVAGEQIDTRQPYRIDLPNGKNIAAFFYDGQISQAVAFEKLLNNGETFAQRLIGSFDNHNEAQLLHIATDGESYGHHHRHGDMALAYALDYIDGIDRVTLTNYGQYLSLFPPRSEVRISENSSWSCIHGVERWRGDCGCNTGMRGDWQQKWRAPLRRAMDLLRDAVDPAYQSLMARYTDDPWGMRNAYIDIILDRSAQARTKFFNDWLRPDAARQPGAEQIALKALEAQRNLLLTYTSCAWFFDEISGTEAVQNLQYAARVIELAREVFDLDLEDNFIAILHDAPSNIPEFGDGEYVYNNFALPARVDFLKLATHLAAAALFENKVGNGALYSFDYEWRDFERVHSGKAQLICAHVNITSCITQETQDIEFVALHLGDHHINIGALPYSGEESYRKMSHDFREIFGKGDIAKSLRLLDQYFGTALSTLNDLFQDQRKKIIDIVMSQTLETVENEFNVIYEQYYPVMRYLSEINVALPGVFSHIARFVQSRYIESELDQPEINIEKIGRHFTEARRWSLDLDQPRIERHYIAALRRSLNLIRAGGNGPAALQQFSDLLEVRRFMPQEIDLDGIQSLFARWIINVFARQKHEDAEDTLVEKIAGQLKIRIHDGVLP